MKGGFVDPMGPEIGNHYQVLNEPLDQIMGGSMAMLKIVHTMVASMTRLDHAVETLFQRMDDMEDQVQTLTYNVQGFEAESESQPRIKSPFHGEILQHHAPAHDIGSQWDGELQRRPLKKRPPEYLSKREDLWEEGALEEAAPEEAAPEASKPKGSPKGDQNKNKPAPKPESKPEPAAAVGSTEAGVNEGGESGESASFPTEMPAARVPLADQYPPGEALDNAAAEHVQRIFRGHRQRALKHMLGLVRGIDMTTKRMPKKLTVNLRLESLENKCDQLKAQNVKLKQRIEFVRAEAAEAVREAKEKADKALRGCKALAQEMTEFRDEVTENMAEQNQRIDTVDATVVAFQDEVAQNFSEQAQNLDTLSKDVAYIQSPEGQEALKDGLIEKQMQGVLDLVQEITNVVDAAKPLPRQDAACVKKLLKTAEHCAKTMEMAFKIEEADNAEAELEGLTDRRPDEWLGALNEPNFMNQLVEVLWATHLCLKEDNKTKQELAAGEAEKEAFLLGDVPVYVDSLEGLLADTGAAIVAVLENFLNKGRQQISIRELWGSLTTIKSEVLRDVTNAVQEALLLKADTEDFNALQKRADAGLRDIIRMKPDVELWAANKLKLIGLDIENFTALEGRVDESFTTLFALGAKVDGKVGNEQMDQILESLQAQFNELEERHAEEGDDVKKLIEPKADRTELAKLARALASGGGGDDPVLAFMTEKPPYSCLSCNRPLPNIPNSVDKERPQLKPAPEVSHDLKPVNVLVPTYDKPLAKVRPPPKQRSLHPTEEHKYALDLASPVQGLGSNSQSLELGDPVSKYDRNIPTGHSRLGNKR
eukprot:CAMPEP_0172624260 /NCGR_PEP_ID=MMETSP1068-20121228/135030_1 /TAXON_ID=35684 /ORGANISM="Pseudopedinella elastica, Strain CCMP716" /LENGTH=821 /DNA_ID=CAMNT_0013433135 /DNA_START=20 /DNA_END=2485 /DNA_ORIENTATION=-